MRKGNICSSAIEKRMTSDLFGRGREQFRNRECLLPHVSQSQDSIDVSSQTFFHTTSSYHLGYLFFSGHSATIAVESPTTSPWPRHRFAKLGASRTIASSFVFRTVHGEEDYAFDGSSSCSPLTLQRNGIEDVADTLNRPCAGGSFSLLIITPSSSPNFFAMSKSLALI
jgi:hypothetical protein